MVVNCEQEIEKAWGMVDQAHSKENEGKETIQRLKQEINNLTKLVEQTAGVSMGQEQRFVRHIIHHAIRSVFIFFFLFYSKIWLFVFL